MRTQRRFAVMVLGLPALALLLTGGGRVAAAPITWGGATNISGDTDVDTPGTLVGALNLGEQGTPNTTVNGVTFVGFSPQGGGTSGPFTFSFVNSTGGTNVGGTPFSAWFKTPGTRVALSGRGPGVTPRFTMPCASTSDNVATLV